MMTVNNHPVVLERVVGNSVHTVIYSDSIQAGTFAIHMHSMFRPRVRVQFIDIQYARTSAVWLDVRSVEYRSHQSLRTRTAYLLDRMPPTSRSTKSPPGSTI